MSFSLNLYGLIAGFAIVVAMNLIELKIKNEKILSQNFYKISIILFIFGVVGARLWHVLTDFYIYKNNLIGTFEIWNGGLSILGGILGGVLGLVVSFNFLFDLKLLEINKKKNQILKFLDYSIYGLPVGQAIGRWGNYFNQELYGAPTNGIFKVFIDVNHRITGYENVAHYHPLFFYEMMATGLFALLFYLNDYKKWLKLPKMGSGKLFLSYVVYYSLIRFFLDFLRIDTAIYLFGVIGINQIILILIIIISVYLIRKK